MARRGLAGVPGRAIKRGKRLLRDVSTSAVKKIERKIRKVTPPTEREQQSRQRQAIERRQGIRKTIKRREALSKLRRTIRGRRAL